MIRHKEGETVNERQKKCVSGLALVIFLVFCAGAGWFIGVPMVRLAREPEQFREWVDTFGIGSRLIYVGMVTLQVVVALIPGEPLELAGGYAFGAMEGTLWAMVGILIGSALVFGLVRRFGVKLVEVFFSRRQIREMAFLKDPKRTKVIAFILMLIPGTPKDFLSYFAGLTKLTLRQWLVIVAVARIPSLITSTISGGAAGSENYGLAAVMLVITLVISAIGGIYYAHICKQQKEETDQQQKKAS